MTLMSGIRNLVTRKKAPPPVDPAAAQAQRRGVPSQSAHAPGAGKVAAEIAVKGGAAAASSPIAIGDGEKLTRLLGEIDDRLGAQTAQTQRLLEPIEGLSHATETLTEINASCTQVIELHNELIEQAKGRERTLDVAVGRLSDATGRHGNELQEVRRLLEDNSQAIRQTAETYNSVIQDLREVLKSCCRSVELISDLEAANETRQRTLATKLARLDRRMVLVASGSAAAAVVALVLAVVALLTG